MYRSNAEEVLWQQSRQIVLARDNHHCVECSTTDALHVHHRVPHALGGTDEPANLVTLCEGCHAGRHPFLQVSLARRTMERWGLRLARWLDRTNQIPANTERLGLALRLLGKERFLEGQLEIVLAALRGESILVVRPTGFGKSLCFQVPAILQAGTTLVVSPLKALMTDQVMHLHKAHLPATFLNSDLSQAEKAARYELLEHNALKFLYCAPERFDETVGCNSAEIMRLKQLRPNYIYCRGRSTLC